jgi:hypothetical protein
MIRFLICIFAKAKQNIMLKKILLGLLIVFVLMQLYRPFNNNGEARGPKDITTVVPTSPEVLHILEVACYDCHSDHTNYPWYTNIQPIGWWIQHHVDEGVEELNFTQFATYPEKRRKHLMHEIEEVVEEGEMPLESYIGQHPEAKLSDDQKHLLEEWAKQH